MEVTLYPSQTFSPSNLITQATSAIITIRGDIICILILTKHYVQTLVGVAQAQWNPDSPQTRTSLVLSDLLLELVPEVDNHSKIFSNLKSFCAHLSSTIAKEDADIFTQLLQEKVFTRFYYYLSKRWKK